MSVCACIAATLPDDMTGSIRLYVTAPLAVGQSIQASAAQAHYLATVMRRSAGDTVCVFNGRDGEFSGRIESIRRDRAALRIEQQLRVQAQEPDIWLLFALLKRDATDLVVRAATELGVADLHPVITERSNTHRMNAERLSAIAIEAAEQCERLTIPRLHPLLPMTARLADWPSGRRLFATLERGDAPPLSPAPLLPDLAPAALLVGPEGGFAPAELDVLRAHPFVTAVSLGPRILRAETACIAGLALLQGMRGA
jgi:16S rRNA (uracil1498-N3)-methyltransferase